MNKYQVALEWLCENSELTQFNINQSQWASETLHELVDKATPKKPTKLKEPVNIEVVDYATHKCSCGFYLFDDGFENYCAKCGKKIDWCKDE